MRQSKLNYLGCLFLVGGTCCAQTVIARKDTKQLRDENSSLFSSYAGRTPVESRIPDGTHREIGKTYFVFGQSPFPPTYHASSLREAYLSTAAVNSDLIVVGEPSRRNSDFDHWHTFIFSDYEVAVDKVLFSRNTTVLPGQKIVVSRPGGKIPIDSSYFIGTVPGFPLFQLHQPYLLFLRLLPNGSFSVYAEAAYLLDGDSVSVHSEPNRQLERKVKRADFDEDVAAAVKLAREAKERAR